MTGDRTQFRQWHRSLVNALNQIEETYGDMMKEAEQLMDTGSTIEDTAAALENHVSGNYDQFNKDLYAIVVDRSAGGAYDKIRSVKETDGSMAYLT